MIIRVKTTGEKKCNAIRSYLSRSAVLYYKIETNNNKHGKETKKTHFLASLEADPS